MRWLAERDDGTMLPVANEIQGNVQSLNRFEIMYTHTEQDKFGNHYGPRMTACKLPDLVHYIKTAFGEASIDISITSSTMYLPTNPRHKATSPSSNIITNISKQQKSMKTGEKTVCWNTVLKNIQQN